MVKISVSYIFYSDEEDEVEDDEVDDDEPDEVDEDDEEVEVSDLRRLPFVTAGTLIVLPPFLYFFPEWTLLALLWFDVVLTLGGVNDGRESQCGGCNL